MTGSALLPRSSGDVARREFARDVLAGLAGQCKAIPSKYLYDEHGSALFERICETPEYYVTRVETGILRDCAPEVAASAGPSCSVIEFGSGAATKTEILLDALATPSAYVCVDVCVEQLAASRARLAKRFPALPITAIAADYMRLEESSLPVFPGGRLGFFPGSTIGNLTPDEVQRFLATTRRVLGHGGMLLIGVDTVKDEAVLNAAYKDAAGVTAAFTINLLRRMNRELDGSFDPDRFRHVAFYNAELQRIEIFVESLIDQVVRVAGRAFTLRAGERIRTEYSYKYRPEQFVATAATVGYAAVGSWMDADELFCVHLLAGV